MRRNQHQPHRRRSHKKQELLPSHPPLIDIEPLTENQRKLFDAYDEDKNIVAYGYPGTGKAQPLYSKILTPTGWKQMGDFQIGDEVVTPEGTTSKIIGIFPQGEREIYEIVFHDGSKTRTCKEHLWECYFPLDKNYKNGSEKKVVKTEDIIEHLEYQKIKKSKDNVNISIDIIKPRETPDIDLPLDPYLLGVILGDGGTTHFPVLITNADQELVEKVSQILEENFYGCHLSKIKTSKYRYSIVVDKEVSKINPISQIVKELNLFGKRSYEKTIPEIYFKASINQKLKLLQGLFDTDGTVASNKKNGQVTFTTTSHQMAKQVQELIWSLGGLATLKQRITSFTHKGVKKQGRVSYTLHLKIRNNKELFYISRKKDRCKDTYDPLQFRRRIKEVNFIGVELAQCIMIDDPNHLYITDDYIITHNTFSLLYKALKEVFDNQTPYKKVVIVRSAVATRDVGYLKGSLEQKVGEFETPYKHMMKSLFDCSCDEEYELLYGNLKAHKSLEFMTTSFIRGLTLNDSIIIVDEFENCTNHELSSIITRVGENSKIHFSGDLEQTDLIKKSDIEGIASFMNILLNMSSFERIDFGIEDIVRSQLVKEFIIAKDKLNLFSSAF